MKTDPSFAPARIRLPRLWFFVLCFGVLGSAAAQTPAVGTLRGRVINEGTGAYLRGAEVEVAGTNLTAITDDEGNFLLGGVPAGPATLRVFYTGLGRRDVPVEVTAGVTTVPNIELATDAYQMEAFSVSELREGNAMAITQQRNAMNVKEVVATDAFGNLRDGNVAELLVLLPGVTGEWVGNDIRTVQIRGFDANLGSVTLDGAKMANAESAGTSRNFEWDVMSADHIESVEVIKAPTPDMEADAIGGTINLKTKSAFNYSAGRRITAQAGLTYESVRESILPNGSFAYSDVLGARKNIGVSFNWGYSRHNVPRDGTQITYPTNTNVPNYMQLLRLYDQENIRERSGGGLKFDYKLSERTEFHVNVLTSFFNEQKGSRSMARRILLQTNAAGIVPGYTDDRVEWRPTQNTLARQETINTPKFSYTTQLGAGARHRLDQWNIDYSGSISQAATWYDSAKYKRGSISPIMRGIGVILDRSETGRHFPTITQTAGPDIYDIANYTAEPLNHRDQRAEDEVYNAQVNVTRLLQVVERPLELKFGARYRSQDRMAFQRNRRFTYLGPDGEAGTGDEGLERFAEDRNYGLVEGRYPAPRWISVKAVSEAWAANPDWFEEDVVFYENNRLDNDRELSESVTAGYVMGNYKLGKLSILGGVRYENTEVEGESNLHAVTPEETARRAAWTGPVNTDEALRRIRAEYATRTKATTKYDNFFPGLHLRYEPRRGLLFRASYSTSIGRPNFGSIIPDTDIGYTNQVITTNNTSLRPQFGKSFNVGVQYYFEPVGVVSVNAFHTKISDFIFNNTSVVGTGPDNGFGGEFAGYELRSQSNGGSATIKGIELNYNQQLVFLPGFLRNFGVFGNYTYLKTDGNYGGSSASPTTQLVGFVPESANMGLSFADFGLEVRVKGTYKGEWLTAYSANPGAVRYTESRFNTDLNILYRFSPRYSVFVDWVNIFNTFDPDYQYRDTLIRTYIPSGSRVNMGVRARF